MSLCSDNLSIMESESFDDLYTLDFYLQTLAKKHEIEKGLFVVHDRQERSRPVNRMG